jgi:dTDP-4-amino-4,6-dideoxygalactose transaminase
MRDQFFPYYRPFIESDDIEAVAKSMRHGWLTTGSKVHEFEEMFSKECDVKHAIALNSCTAAIHLGLIALGIGPGDDVIMPSLSFVAGANCVRQLGGRPIFADVDKITLCITPVTIDAVVTPRTKVVLTMNYGGQPVGISSIVSYARQRGITVLEDAAHAVGTLDQGKWPGTESDAAAFSFYATKNITSAEGGMLVTNRDDVMERVRGLSLHGMNKDAWQRYTQGGKWGYDVSEVGYKYNMPDMAAALGMTQLGKLSMLQARRAALADIYVSGLSRIPGITVVTKPAARPNQNSWCLFVVSVDEAQAGISRDQLIQALHDRNIGTSVHFIPTHTFSAYKGVDAYSVPNTDRMWKTLVSLPLYPSMSGQDTQDVVDAIRSIVDASVRRKTIAVS